MHFLFLFVDRFDSAKLKFQLSDPDAYFVHHMSMYEHFNHKKFGFEVAKNKTLIMSRAAVEGECENLVVSKTKNIVAFIPFFGGLPPGVTKDLTVKSIGQGNSLVGIFYVIFQSIFFILIFSINNNIRLTHPQKRCKHRQQYVHA